MNLQKNDHIHFMGVCGTAMASLACLLKKQGYKVTGSDQNVYPPMSDILKQAGIEIMEGYHAKNLNQKPHLVIVGNVISRHFDEAQALLKSDIPYMSLPKAIGEFLIADRTSLVVTGTHGKTTTTSMLAYLSAEQGLTSGYLVGGIPKNLNCSFQIPIDDYFIIEGDEYDTAFFDKVSKFLHYKPQKVILSNIEFDHADIYKDLDHVKESFLKLMTKIPRDTGFLVFNADDPDVCDVAKTYLGEKISFGENNGDVLIKFIQEEKFTKVELKSKLWSEDKIFYLSVYGKYNILNATAAFLLGLHLGWDEKKLKEALKSFSGVKRRQELLGTPGGVRVIEDFAHHPTAVRLTVEALKKRYPEGSLFTLFEPRSATSRRKIFQEAYSNSFKGADVVYIAKPYNQINIDDKERFSSEELVQDLLNKKIEASVIKGIDVCVQEIKEKVQPGDTILIMSNGAFEGIYKKLLKIL